MNIEALKEHKIPDIVIERLKAQGIKTLNEPQAMSIDSGLFEGKNLVVSAPTSSGKTLIMTLASVNSIINKGGKTIYLAPLRALASEMHAKHTELFKDLPIKVAISTGDFDSSDSWLKDYDFIILTPEKLDSLLRHTVPWINKVSTIVVDEIHTLDQPDRGPVLEILITRLRKFCPNAQILALSATIKNCDELAGWLGAELVKSQYRPVLLRKGVLLDGHVDYGEVEEPVDSKEKEEELQLIEDTLSRKKQALLFLSSRRNAEGAAKKCLKTVDRHLSAEEKMKLEGLSDQILNVLETPTKQCEDLAMCIKKGVAFHHAGLVSKQRELIEDNFRGRLIKVICATPTLAAGCNTPAHTVIVRDLKRFGDEGMGWLPVLEVHQMIGRAGRPQYDTEGRGLLIAHNEIEKKTVLDKYINGEPEEIYSKLSVEPVLRMQILGLITSGEVRSRKELLEFFSRTFYFHQYKSADKLEFNIEKIIANLIEWGFIRSKQNAYEVTTIGRRVSELYLDPYSAMQIIEQLKHKSKKTDFYYMNMTANCLEMVPLLRIGAKEFEELKEKSLIYDGQMVEEPSYWDGDYERWVRAFKTTLLFQEWINEVSEAHLLEKYGETPGALHSKLKILDWLLYSITEIANLIGKKDELLPLRRLRIRAQTGAKEELLALLKFRGIGRKRARKLYVAGIKNVGDVREASMDRLSSIIGNAIALSIKKQVNSPEEVQSELEDFKKEE